MDSQSNSTTAPTVSIAGVEITTDKAGRFNLNALHRASGAEKKDGPAYWLALDSTQKLVAELNEQTTEISVVSKEGRNGGTFVNALLAISYAGWISPSFQLTVNRVFLDARSGKAPMASMPLPQKLKAVGDVMYGFSRLAGLLGLKGNQRVLSAAMATRRETGVDVLQLAGVTHLDADMQEQDLNPTLIGSRLDPEQTAARVNEVLEAMGLQIKHSYVSKGKPKHYWELTPEGEKVGALYKDTTKTHQSGTPVKQIRWPVSVIAMVQDHIGEALL